MLTASGGHSGRIPIVCLGAMQTLPRLILERQHDSDLVENISAQGMVDFIHSMPSLQLLYVRNIFHSSWSLEIFIVIAQHERLLELKLPRVLDERIPEFASFLPESMFSKTNLIELDRSDTFGKTLLPCLARIGSIIQSPLRRRPRGALRCVASSPGLVSLTFNLEPDEARQQTDLPQLNERCTKLYWLYIIGRKYSTSTFSVVPYEYIADTTIDQVARYHPKLCSLKLSLTGSTLTEHSLLSFSKYCKGMTSMVLIAGVSLEALLHKDHPKRFPELQELDLRPPASDRRRYSNPEQVAERLLEAAPKLTTLNLGAKNLTLPSEEVVSGIVYELIKERLK